MLYPHFWSEEYRNRSWSLNKSSTHKIRKQLIRSNWNVYMPNQKLLSVVLFHQIKSLCKALLHLDLKINRSNSKIRNIRSQSKMNAKQRSLKLLKSIQLLKILKYSRFYKQLKIKYRNFNRIRKKWACLILLGMSNAEGIFIAATRQLSPVPSILILSSSSQQNNKGRELTYLRCWKMHPCPPIKSYLRERRKLIMGTFISSIEGPCIEASLGMESHFR